VRSGRKRHHNTPLYRRMAPLIRAAAYADASYTCPICDLTLAERQAITPKAGWDCGHIVAKDETMGFRAECSHCNRSAGAKEQNAKRHPNSQQW